MSTVLDTCIIVDVASVHMPLCGSSTTVFELHTPSLTSDTNSDTLTPTNKYLVTLMLYSYDSQISSDADVVQLRFTNI